MDANSHSFAHMCNYSIYSRQIIYQTYEKKSKNTKEFERS